MFLFGPVTAESTRAKLSLVPQGLAEHLPPLGTERSGAASNTLGGASSLRNRELHREFFKPFLSLSKVTCNADLETSAT